jgi:hypothetical protein
MWLLLACVAHHPPLGLDPSASLALVSPPATGNPHSVTLRATTDAERIEFWVDGVRVGDTLPGEPLPWRAPETGVARVEAFAMRDGRAVARARQDTELGVGLSDVVASIVDTYPTDGTMGFYWPPDDGIWWGTTRDVTYAGQLVNGIGYHEDRFGEAGISKSLFYVARLWQKEDWVAPPGSPSR